MINVDVHDVSSLWEDISEIREHIVALYGFLEPLQTGCSIDKPD
jgi:hypothetical protein